MILIIRSPQDLVTNWPDFPIFCFQVCNHAAFGDKISEISDVSFCLNCNINVACQSKAKRRAENALVSLSRSVHVFNIQPFVPLNLWLSVNLEKKKKTKVNAKQTRQFQNGPFTWYLHVFLKLFWVMKKQKRELKFRH